MEVLKQFINRTTLRLILKLSLGVRRNEANNRSTKTCLMGWRLASQFGPVSRRQAHYLKVQPAPSRRGYRGLDMINYADISGGFYCQP